MKAKLKPLKHLPVPVKVMTENGPVFGRWVDNVTVYIIVGPEGVVLSKKLAEKRPTNQEAAEIGGQIEKIDGNPKIILNSGKVVYGCQVWWETIVEQN